MYMSGSVISPNLIFVILRTTCKLKPGTVKSSLGHTFLSYYFYIFRIPQLTINNHTLSTSRDNLSLFSFQIPTLKT